MNPFSRKAPSELPATLRFLEERSGQAIAEPYVLSSVEPAMVLLGPGEFTIENLALETACSAGTLINRVNGIAAPKFLLGSIALPSVRSQSSKRDHWTNAPAPVALECQSGSPT